MMGAGDRCMVPAVVRCLGMAFEAAGLLSILVGGSLEGTGFMFITC